MVKCLETRRRHGMKWRRYRMPDGVTFTTYEVPVAVLGEIGAVRLKRALERAEREMARRTRNAKILQLSAEGWPNVAIANEVGVCDSHARHIVAEARRKSK